MEFDQPYRLTQFHFWNFWEAPAFSTETYDVDQIDIDFFGIDDGLVSELTVFPATIGSTPSAETFEISPGVPVVSAQLTLSGSNGFVDFQNIAFTGNPLVAPVAVDDEAISDGTAVTIDAIDNDTDADGTVVDADLVSGTTDGTVFDNDDGTFTFTPAAGFSGAATFTYVAVDDDGLTSNVATVTVTVTSDEAPTAIDDEFTAATFGPITVDVIANDVDPDGTIVDAETVMDAAHADVVDNGDGTFTVTPSESGPVAFSYVAVDDDGNLSNEATVTIDFPAPLEAPVAFDDAATSDGSAIIIDVIANDTDADGVVVDAAIVSGSADGTVTDNDDGTITFTPTPGFAGETTFQYAAFDDDGLRSNDATVTVTVEREPDGKVCDVITAGQPSESFAYDEGCLRIEGFDTDDLSREETTSDTITFTFQGDTIVLNEVQDFLDFARRIESDGDGDTDAVYNTDGDLAFIFARNEDGSVADGMVFVDVVAFDGDPSINDGLTVERLQQARADMFDMFSDEDDAFCGFTLTGDDGAFLS